MRLWSLHPRYLDPAGLTAAWREALLAQKVLTGTTRGYRSHPQLVRFLAGSALAGEAGDAVGRLGREAGDPSGAEVLPWPGERIVVFLHVLVDEATARGYFYDRARIVAPRPEAVGPVLVTDGQVAYEWDLLRTKVAARSPEWPVRWTDVAFPEVHPLFTPTPGPVAPWERVRLRPRSSTV